MLTRTAFCQALLQMIRPHARAHSFFAADRFALAFRLRLGIQAQIMFEKHFAFAPFVQGNPNTDREQSAYADYKKFHDPNVVKAPPFFKMLSSMGDFTFAGARTMHDQAGHIDLAPAAGLKPFGCGATFHHKHNDGEEAQDAECNHGHHFLAHIKLSLSGLIDTLTPKPEFPKRGVSPC